MSYAFRGADRIEKGILLAFWSIAAGALLASVGKRLAGWAAGGLYIGVHIRWRRLAAQSSRSYETIANAEMEVFSEWVAEAIVGLVVQLPPYVALGIAIVVVTVVFAWRLRRVFDMAEEMWHTLSWPSRIVYVSLAIAAVYVTQTTTLPQTATAF